MAGRKDYSERSYEANWFEAKQLLQHGESEVMVKDELKELTIPKEEEVVILVACFLIAKGLEWLRGKG